MKLSIVIPVYNESQYLYKLLAKVVSVHLPNQFIHKEIILIDDCSTDGTIDLLKKLEQDKSTLLDLIIVTLNNLHPDYTIANKEEAIKLLNEVSFIFLYQSKNQGKGAALRKGIDMSTGDYVIIQDADLEYDPNDYGNLLKPVLENKADVVYGSRFRGVYTRVLYYKHMLGNKFLTTFSNIFSDLNLTDMETCYKLFNGNLIRSIYLSSNRFGFEPEITAKIARANVSIYEVPISYYGRTYAEGKKISWKDGISAIWFILKYNLICRRVFKENHHADCISISNDNCKL
ncbi:MAG: hypothetical protein A3E87_01990 [Gammaproteobacteria bacterium RIFCSPHIGHO2_12_FULL_35_23]|nr:MAG: hypothetical protein A3E87_01990 [Gammaproteobacteria bacterium RIFCSPHIGHO2_12_FULL_35_23]